MNSILKDLQEKQFGGLHNFLSNLSFELIEALQNKYGEDIIAIIEKINIDHIGLYRWHLQRILLVIDTLKAKYGEGVEDIVADKIALIRYNEGAKLAQNLDKNSLDDLIPSFTFGNNENILERKDNEVIIKSNGCFAGKIARDLGRSDILFNLYCKSDYAFVSGFNDKLGCVHIKTVMNADDCCIHKLYFKD